MNQDPAPAYGSDAFVRQATLKDVDRLGEVQSRVWRDGYAGVLPAETLAELDPASLACRWRKSLIDPPSPQHRALVAVTRGDVVGFAVTTPAEDPDLDPQTDAELTLLVVDPAHRGAGHGSRLLTACVDHLREDGYQVVHAWLSVADDALRNLLVSAGWGPDGASRSLDLRGDGAIVVAQTRLHTQISETAAR